MTDVTLNKYIENRIEKRPEFAEHYQREQAINEIACMVVKARKDKRLTQAELAKKIGTTQSVVSMTESGKSSFVPSLDTLLKIAHALQMSLKLRFQ